MVDIIFAGRPTSKFPKNTHVPLASSSFPRTKYFSPTQGGGGSRADRNLKSVLGREAGSLIRELARKRTCYSLDASSVDGSFTSTSFIIVVNFNSNV